MIRPLACLIVIGLMAAASLADVPPSDTDTPDIAASGVTSTAPPDLTAGFVRLSDHAPQIRLDIRYATAENFVGAPVPGYSGAECILTRAAADALVNADKSLRSQGFALVVHDCTRPLRAVAHLTTWVATGPDAPLWHPDIPRRDLITRGYIAARSGHARGSTVDAGLIRPGDANPRAPNTRCDRTTEAVDMGTPFDCFSPRSGAAARITPQARKNRAILTAAMTAAGFKGYAREWWHFRLSPEPFPDTEFDFEIK
ncbi:MAG: M15 family metallopeptidase [Gemmobacter sp.]|nr:M15 family metallopeptidase [Gemmobacter sp.]